MTISLFWRGALEGSERPLGNERAHSRLINTPGRQLFAVERGSGTPVVFLHGIPTYSYLWRDLLPVAALSHRVIALDLSGFGRSEKRPDWDYSVAAQADAVRSALRQLDIERAAFVAHDFGVLVAAELLAREPELVTHLVLLNTSLRPAAWGGSLSPLSILRLPIIGELALVLSRRWMLKRAMAFYVDRRDRLTDDVMAHYWWPFEHGFKRTLLKLARQRLATPGDFERWRDTLAHLAVPRLIVWGASDPTFTLAEMRDLEQLMPQARVQPIANANHFLPEDKPRATARLINAFLAGLE
jgi:pimeloyl-ACP methyl ester carboxylesterase